MRLLVMRSNDNRIKQGNLINVQWHIRRPHIRESCSIGIQTVTTNTIHTKSFLIITLVLNSMNHTLDVWICLLISYLLWDWGENSHINSLQWNWIIAKRVVCEDWLRQETSIGWVEGNLRFYDGADHEPNYRVPFSSICKSILLCTFSSNPSKCKIKRISKK